jgi:hypothetical protein
MAFNASPQYPGSYLGVRAPHPPNILQHNYIPTPNNWQNVVVGDIWIYIPTPISAAGRRIFMLISLVGNQATWVEISASGGTVIGLSGNAGLNPVFPTAGGIINVVGDGLTINVTGDGVNTLTVSAVGTGLIQTITGNINGPIAPIAGNFNIVTANATVLFAGTPGTETLDFNRTSNLVLGTSMPTLTSGTANSGYGPGVFNAVTSGSFNAALGNGAGHSLTSGSDNTLSGFSSGVLISTGSFNTSIGSLALNFLTTGTGNIALGTSSASLFTSNESYNIIIGNPGTIGDSNTIRIGLQGSGPGQQDTTYIAGIAGVAVVNLQYVTINSTNGQLGSQLAGFAFNYTSVNNAASPYTVLSTDYYISVDATAGAVTIRLPNAPTANRVFVIKDRLGVSATNNITVTTVGGAVLIDGATSYALNNNYQSIELIFNGSSYEIY